MAAAISSRLRSFHQCLHWDVVKTNIPAHALSTIIGTFGEKTFQALRFGTYIQRESQHRNGSWLFSLSICTIQIVSWCYSSINFHGFRGVCCSGAELHYVFLDVFMMLATIMGMVMYFLFILTFTCRLSESR